MRKSGVVEKYVRLVQDTTRRYKESVTMVKFAVETTDGFSMEVRLYQGLALSPLLFPPVMDRLKQDEVRSEPSWTMMFEHG